jgi:hypothetical protein
MTNAYAHDRRIFDLTANTARYRQERQARACLVDLSNAVRKLCADNAEYKSIMESLPSSSNRAIDYLSAQREMLNARQGEQEDPIDPYDTYGL